MSQEEYLQYIQDWINNNNKMLLEKEVNSLVVEIIKEHEKINAGKGIEHAIVSLKILKNAIYSASKMPKNDDTSYKLWKIRTIMDKNIESLTTLNNK